MEQGSGNEKVVRVRETTKKRARERNEEEERKEIRRICIRNFAEEEEDHTAK